MRAPPKASPAISDDLCPSLRARDELRPEGAGGQKWPGPRGTDRSEWKCAPFVDADLPAIAVRLLGRVVVVVRGRHDCSLSRAAGGRKEWWIRCSVMLLLEAWRQQGRCISPGLRVFCRSAWHFFGDASGEKLADVCKGTLVHVVESCGREGCSSVAQS